MSKSKFFSCGHFNNLTKKKLKNHRFLGTCFRVFGRKRLPSFLAQETHHIWKLLAETEIHTRRKKAFPKKGSTNAELWNRIRGFEVKFFSRLKCFFVKITCFLFHMFQNCTQHEDNACFEKIIRQFMAKMSYS